MLTEATMSYHQAGLCVLPAKRAEKRPAVGSWKRYQKQRPTDAELSAWMANPRNSPDAICILCGSTSNNAEMIDFDAGGELFAVWRERIPAELHARLVVESTPARGYHVCYRCEAPVCGNLKLAQRKVGDKVHTLIETRGEGGLFLCAPTPGYALVQGDLASLPVITAAERDKLLQAAWELNEYVPPVVNGPQVSANVGQTAPSSAAHAALSADNSHNARSLPDNGKCAPTSADNANIVESRSHNADDRQLSADNSNNPNSRPDNQHHAQLSADNAHMCGSRPENADRPGDDFNIRGDVRSVLEQHGWVRVSGGQNEYWRRPGKDSGWSATLKDRVFYVFSANAAPFEPNRAYSPFSVYALLNCGGDFEHAARSLRTLGFGDDSLAHVGAGVDLSGIVGGSGQYATHNAHIRRCVTNNAEIGHGATHNAEIDRCATHIAENAHGAADNSENGQCATNHADIRGCATHNAENSHCASHNADIGRGAADIADIRHCGPDNADSSDSRPDIADPGPMPEDMLRVPGFISEVMDYCLATAPYPNQVMAFAGALSLQAFLAGRKVRDPGDNRTNLYLLGLAHSSAGKDWPRKVNTRILHQVALADCLGERFASGEGIQDALFQTPCMLFQTDEIDGMLQSINKAKDARHEAVMSTLLTMYSSANSVFPMRRKASTPNKAPPGVIDQPCLVIFGTAIPNHYYEALSERMLTNGFFARMIILEAGQRGSGQEPGILDLPQRVIQTARWWTEFNPGERRGNLIDMHPVPAIVEHTDEARRLLVETREEAEEEYARAEAKNDSVGTTVWGRVSEQTRKLSLLYAISANHQEPSIGIEAVQWASRFVLHQTRRMLFMAAGHVAENPFHAECLKLIQKLRKAPGHELPHSVLLKRMKTDAKSFAVLIDTLCQQGEVELVTTPKPGWHMRSYRLARR